MTKTQTTLLLLVSMAAGAGSCSKTRPPHRDRLSQPLALDVNDTYTGLRNVFNVTGNVLSGSNPEGDAGFDALQRIGVQTIISVDGARPDVQRAKVRGMRYAHLPIGYDGIPLDHQRRFAKALRDLPKPIYLHCHHGRHRGPTAAAVAAVSLGWMDRAQAVDFMKRAGTSAHYTGLYACIEQASVIQPASLDSMSADFPEIARVSGITKTMSEIEYALTHLRAVRAAGWRSPDNHPDLVPVAEAARLFDLFRNLQGDPSMRNRPDEFVQFLSSATDHAGALEEAFTSGSNVQLESRFRLLEASCKNCHAKYRD